MDDARLAPTVGILASLAVTLVLVVPYLLIDDPTAVDTYYGTGAFNPLLAGLFALVSVIVFAAGREERSDPALTAGAALVFGGFILALVVVWAVTVPVDVVLSLTTLAAFEYHRYALVLVALFVPASATWYARVLGLL